MVKVAIYGNKEIGRNLPTSMSKMSEVKAEKILRKRTWDGLQIPLQNKEDSDLPEFGRISG